MELSVITKEPKTDFEKLIQAKMCVKLQRIELGKADSYIEELLEKLADLEQENSQLEYKLLELGVDIKSTKKLSKRAIVYKTKYRNLRLLYISKLGSFDQKAFNAMSSNEL